MNTKYIIFGCVLLLVLLISMSSACGVLPYSATTRSYAIVEGAETKVEFNDSINKLLDEIEKLEENKDNEELKKKIKEIRTSGIDGYDTEKLKKELDNVTKDKSTKTYKTIMRFVEEKLGASEEAKKEEQEDDVEGFNNYEAASGSIDIFGSAVGNQSCVKTASGLTNSMGALCLSEEQLYMLRSRGGNSSGRDSQIGM
jgi:hypothetical protein